eukprot:scaffold15463_cov118-Isochrysis_galbana.AAC.2
MDIHTVPSRDTHGVHAATRPRGRNSANRCGMWYAMSPVRLCALSHVPFFFDSLLGCCMRTRAQPSPTLSRPGRVFTTLPLAARMFRQVPGLAVPGAEV